MYDSEILALNLFRKVTVNSLYSQGGCPSLVVMGGDSCSDGCGFESSTIYCMDIFSHIFDVKNLMFA